MQNPYKYSVDDIARMRIAVQSLTGTEGAEDRLRTYMFYGTLVWELEEAAEAARRAREDERRNFRSTLPPGGRVQEWVA